MLLLLPLFGARGRVAFSSGFLHGLVFVLTSLYWIAIVLEVHGGLSHLGGIGVLLLIALAWGVLTGLFAWCVNFISRRSIARACIAAPFLWVALDRKSTRLNSSHGYISYAVFCLKKKNQTT